RAYRPPRLPPHPSPRSHGTNLRSTREFPLRPSVAARPSRLVSSLGIGVEEQLHVTAKMMDAGNGDLCFAGRLGENEGSLEDCLRVECQAPGSPVRSDSPIPHRFGDVALDLGGVGENAAAAGVAD